MTSSVGYQTPLGAPACSCGCGSVWLLTKALEPCSCGCSCCRRQPESTAAEIAELVALEAAIGARLRALESAAVASRRQLRHRRWSSAFRRGVHRGAAFILVLTVVAGLALSFSSRAPLDGEVGRPAPVFALRKLAGEGQMGTGELRGKLVVVSFWASWCRPCIEESRLLEEVWRRHRHEDVVVLGINVQDVEGDAMAFLRRNNVTYPTVVDTGVVAGSFGVTGLPETYFLDGDWLLVAVNRGHEKEIDQSRGWVIRESINPSILERWIQGLLATRYESGGGKPRGE